MTAAQRALFGKRIAARREVTGISQRKLAPLLGVCNSYLCHIEAGRRVPSIGFLYKLAAILGGHAGGYLP